MDPLESVREYRDRPAPPSPARLVSIAPPPVLPPQPTPEPAPTPPAEEPAAAEAEPKIVGTPRGRKQLLHIYLPNASRQLLEGAREGHGSLGAAAMAALRGAYDHVVTNCVPEPVEAVGPFPAPRPPRRRMVVDDARMKTIYVEPAEAAAIEALAEQCELSLSELVTIAIDHHYGPNTESPDRTSQGRPTRTR